MTHELKCLPLYFQAVHDGRKPFEVRKNDRGFRCGDMLWLREYDPSGLDRLLMRNPYTGRSVYRRVTYILSAAEFLQPGFVVLGLSSETELVEKAVELEFAQERIRVLESSLIPEGRETRGPAF